MRALLLAVSVALAAPLVAHAQPAAPKQAVAFDWFEYRGDDPVFATPLPAGHYRNPILAGFYPDPSITRVGERYYLVNSTFAYFPAIPVFESTDLVHWTQVGNVVERREQLDYDGLGVSRGMFAASIRHHAGRFYVVGTAVDSGGNFITSATSAAGPWSTLSWLPGVDGIDPSLFFDTDGSAYLLNNGPREGTPLYEGHRAIWMQRFDLATHQPVGLRKVLLNGGVDLASKPIWIEGPHLYQRDGWYYLSCAEGGTGPQHSQVVLRSRNVWGPYAPAPHNPILTQRDLRAGRAQPISNAGHVDLVDTPDGQWWAVFLASRPYADDRYNTGRETFLLPVQWRDGWPSILPPGAPIPYVAKAPHGTPARIDQTPLSGNFTWRDGFDAPRRSANGCRCACPSVTGPTCVHARAGSPCTPHRKDWPAPATRRFWGGASSTRTSPPAPRWSCQPTRASAPAWPRCRIPTRGTRWAYAVMAMARRSSWTSATARAPPPWHVRASRSPPPHCGCRSAAMAGATALPLMQPGTAGNGCSVTTTPAC